ncbi:NADH dehydrogenase I, chain G [gamma proteobacterium HdN1]|nr:NADH dehydrogenase I, chain G [gamma proteobacterium HdN1]
MATIHVDGKEYEVDGADNLLQACLSLGLDIPYFCWHPALGSVGACRQCAVKQYANADDKRGRLVMSCMTPASDGTIISISDEEARAFREGVVEWLMINHPHDCPVCEEGGACHLQDVVVMTGHSKRRYRFTKRTHQNQNLGPFVNHEMNRCIACYRCVRYYKDYAGGTDLGVYSAHDNVYFGRNEDGVLESEFSGNLVEVCPTGVFTDQTHSTRYNRKWDMQFAPSVCQQCSVGCNVSPGERYGELRRIENRYNGSVNHYFLCDRGRFGYGYVNRKDRLRRPYLKTGVSADWTLQTVNEAVDHAAAAIKAGARVLGIGSSRASLESNFALRTLVGEQNFFSGVAAKEHALIAQAIAILSEGPAKTPSLREIESFDAVLVLGEDVTQTAPRVALALRQASRNKAIDMAAARKIFDWQAAAILDIGQRAKSPIFIASLAATRLDDVAEQTYHAAPEDIARLGFAVAHLLNADAPAVENLAPEVAELAKTIADALSGAKKPLIVAGTSLQNEAIIHAAANLSRALFTNNPAVGLSIAFPEVNSVGLGMLNAGSLDDALARAAAQPVDVAIVLENNLYRRAPKVAVDKLFENCKQVIVVDHQRTETTAKASQVLPAGTFAEASGSVVSMEGRAQRFYQVFDPAFYHPNCLTRSSWKWLHGIAAAVNGEAPTWGSLDDATAACANAFPLLAGISDAAPEGGFRITGLKLARSPKRYSGRTAQRAHINVHEPAPARDPDTPFAFSMEGYSGTEAPGSLTPFAWSPGWNSPQAWNKYQDEVNGKLRQGDPGILLFKPEAAPGNYFAACDAFHASSNQWRVVPSYHLFGSEELSARAEVTESVQVAPYIGISEAHAAALKVGEGATLSITVGGHALTLPVKILNGLPAGLVALPQGVAGLPVFAETEVVCTIGGAA